MQPVLHECPARCLLLKSLKFLVHSQSPLLPQPLTNPVIPLKFFQTSDRLGNRISDTHGPVEIQPLRYDGIIK